MDATNKVFKKLSKKNRLVKHEYVQKQIVDMLEELKTLRKINGRLQGHPAPFKTHGLQGIEIASGSLEQVE